MVEHRKLITFCFLSLFLMLQFLAVPVFSSLNENTPVFQKGMSFSAWTPDAFADSTSDESLRLLVQTNTEWIAICFSWYQSNTTSSDIELDPARSPTIDSIQHAITTAHSLGLKVMLKPMVEPNEREEVLSYPVWRGEIVASDEWFASYSSFLNFFAEFAEDNNVEMFCVGCEYKATTSESEQWRSVVQGVRERFSGPLVYAADWTNYEDIDWWDCVDYVGIDAYFPLSLLNSGPSLEALTAVWNNHADDIEEWIATVNKPVIFTEIGYRSGDGTSMAPSNYWADMDVDLQEQSDCYTAAFEALWDRDWFYGFYWWTWIHEPTKGGVTDSYHTPQNKPVEDVITSWYSLTRQVAVVDQTFVSTQKCLIGESVFVGFHVSWERDGSDVVDAKVYINGTEYTTNSSGWAGFDAFYASVGERRWTVTDLTHSEASGYAVTVANPSVVWDSVVIEVDVSEVSFGTMSFTINVVNGYDGTSVTGVTVLANGETATETQPGIYEIQLNSWNAVQQLDIVIDEINYSAWYSNSFDNLSNTALYIAVIAALIASAIIVWMRHRKSNKIEY